MRFPAGDNESPQPTSLYADPRSGEIYLADATSGRIAIYDAQRRFNFEFSTLNRLASPRQIAVDSLGRIFVLGDTRQHSLAVFDYNGRFQNYLDLSQNDNRIEPHSFALDLDDHIYALTVEPLLVHQFSANGDFLRDFPLLADADNMTRTSPIMGNLTVQSEYIVLPLSMIGVVALINLDGQLVRYYGAPGGGPGELSFPIAATLLHDGGLAILDKHRHLVQFFDRDANYLMEVGNCGLSEGNFFHPTTMLACADGSLAVGQTLNNRIQQVMFQEPPVASGP